MPDLDGPAVLDWLEKHQPALAHRVGFCAGGQIRDEPVGPSVPGDESVGPSALGNDRFLAKPFQRQELERFIEYLSSRA